MKRIALAIVAVILAVMAYNPLAEPAPAPVQVVDEAEVQEIDLIELTYGPTPSTVAWIKMRMEPYYSVIEEVRKSHKVQDGKTSADVFFALEKAYYQYGLDRRRLSFDDWIAQAKTENNFDTTKRGSSGEYGMMQIMPGTAIWLNEFFNIPDFDPAMLNDPYLNAEFAAKYMQLLLDEHGNVGDAQECYNAGPRGVSRSAYRSRIRDVASQFFGS